MHSHIKKCVNIYIKIILREKKGFLLLRHSIPEIDENNNNEVNETDITSTVEEVEKICGNFKLELQQE